MAFVFHGFFVRASNNTSAHQLQEAVKVRWPDAVTRLVTQPFFGIGVQLPTDKGLEADLSVWSLQFPQQMCVALMVECFGGVCEYRGFVCHRGKILFKEEQDDGEVDVLQRLLNVLDVTLDARGYFAPLERGFFDSDPFPT